MNNSNIFTGCYFNTGKIHELTVKIKSDGDIINVLHAVSEIRKYKFKIIENIINRKFTGFVLNMFFQFTRETRICNICTRENIKNPGLLAK